MLPDALTTVVDELVMIKRKLREKNITKIKDDLSKIDWKEKLENCIDCDDKFNEFHDVVLKSLDNHAPLKACPRKGKTLSEPWLTKGLLKCNKKQKTLFHNTLQIEGAQVTTHNVEYYRTYRALLQKYK